MSRTDYKACIRSEQGFTLIELLVAVLILLIGIVATIGVFGSSKRTTLVAQRHEMAVHIAQKEMEAMRSFKYAELGLDVGGNPAGPYTAHVQSSDPNHPNSRISTAGRFIVSPGSGAPCSDSAAVCEEQVTRDTGASQGKVNPGPESFTVGEGSSAVSGQIYRYVSWRDERCAALICDGARNTKRLSVAVTLNPVGTPPIGPRKPVWETSIASDPNEGPTSSNDPPPPPPPPPTTSAQNFYLYDKRCDDSDANNGYSAPTAPDTNPADGRPDYDHATYDTASDVALCENTSTNPVRRPNLMGPVAPTYANAPVPPYKYSTDLSGDYPAGLAMKKPDGGSSCPGASYPAADWDNVAPPTQPSQWTMHTWATKKFSSPFQLSGRVFLSIWTTSVGSFAGTGRFCATLVDRRNASGAPNDIVLGSMSREYTPWPTTKNEPGRSCGTADFPCGRQLSFSMTLPATSVRTDSRLVLILSVLSTSEKDIVLLYDDPRYRSLLEVETSTPCSSSGSAPCPPS